MNTSIKRSHLICFANSSMLPRLACRKCGFCPPERRPSVFLVKYKRNAIVVYLMYYKSPNLFQAQLSSIKHCFVCRQLTLVHSFVPVRRKFSPFFKCAYLYCDTLMHGRRKLLQSPQESRKSTSERNI